MSSLFAMQPAAPQPLSSGSSDDDDDDEDGSYGGASSSMGGARMAAQAEAVVGRGEPVQAITGSSNHSNDTQAEGPLDREPDQAARLVRRTASQSALPSYLQQLAALPLAALPPAGPRPPPGFAGGVLRLWWY